MENNQISDTARTFFDNMSTSSVDQMLQKNRQKVFTATKFEDDKSDYQMKTNGRGDVIFVEPDKNDRLREEINVKSLQPLLDVIGKIKACKTLKLQKEALATYQETYQLSQDDVEFIIKQTGIIIDSNPQNLRTFETSICSNETLQKFFREEKKTRRNWMNTKKVILYQFLSIQVKNQDDVDLEPKIAKLFLFDDKKNSVYNDFVGFKIDKNKEGDNVIFKEVDKVNHKLLYLVEKGDEAVVKKGRSWSQRFKDVENIVASSVGDFVKKTRDNVGSISQQIGSSVYEYGASFLSYANPFKYVYGDGAIYEKDKNKYLIIGESENANGPFDGGIIFFMKYVDHVLNNCLRNNLDEFKWRWEIDLDDLTPLNCAEVKKCWEEDVIAEDGNNQQAQKIKERCKKSLKHLKKEYKDGNMSRQIYKERSRDLKRQAKKQIKQL